MSPAIVTSNSNLYNFHRPKLRAHDTPHPLKRESELYLSNVVHSIPTITHDLFPVASRTSQHIVQSVRLRHIRAHVVLLYSWHCSSDERAIFTFYSASKSHISTIVSES